MNTFLEKNTHTNSQKPWVEKYRPKTIDEVQSQDEIIKTLSENINVNNLPHLLFYGNPGTGKTSTILALARDLFGSTISERVLELNASDERGIDVIRDKVKNFASRSINTEKAPFKLIILDEADSMTNDAQSALRRIIEKYTNVTRFCLICNYVSRIIEPLASRCVKYRFTPLPPEGILKKLQEISEKENVDVSDSTLNHIIELSKGDLRRAITMLQTASSFNDQHVTTEIILDISGSIDKEFIEKIWYQIVNNSSNYSDSSNHGNNSSNYRNTPLDSTREIIDYGYSVSMFLENLHQIVLNHNSDELSDYQKASLIILISTCDDNLKSSADEHLQLLNLFYQITQIVKVH
jgi:replication factor C subunit 2/4